MSELRIRDFNHLVDLLSNWRSYREQESGFSEYDRVGLFELFCACLANMRQNYLPDDIQEMGETLTVEERHLLTQLLTTDYPRR